MQELAQIAIDHLKKKKVDYADARLVEIRQEKIVVKNGNIDAIAHQASKGLGIRVLNKGAWGFSAVSDLSPKSIVGCAESALEIARASALSISEPARLADRPAERGKWKSPREKNPFDVPLGQKIEFLTKPCNVLRKDRLVTTARASMSAREEKKYYLDTEGAKLEQDILHCGAMMLVIAGDGGDTQTRSFPTNFSEGDWSAAGYEWIEQIDLVGHAERLREETIELLSAPECPHGQLDVIIGGQQLALQIHESCGHPTELDRALGTEISLAGGSFMTPERLNKLQYGSKLVNLYADAGIPGALGTFGWDDEGVPARRFDIVREGLFVGYQTSRETAAQFGQRSNGTMRAESWASPPLIRMTNINLAADPNGPSLDELIADTKNGLYLDVNKSWSIDDLRLNFSFGCEYARLIENGKLGPLVKNPIYTGITPQFWGSCDAVANQSGWRVWGLPNCGKGQPMQMMRVAHGCNAARFRNIQVGRQK